MTIKQTDLCTLDDVDDSDAACNKEIWEWLKKRYNGVALEEPVVEFLAEHPEIAEFCPKLIAKLNQFFDAPGKRPNRWQIAAKLAVKKGSRIEEACLRKVIKRYLKVLDADDKAFYLNTTCSSRKNSSLLGMVEDAQWDFLVQVEKLAWIRMEIG